MRFYGPRERKMGLLGFLRVGVWLNGLRAFRSGFVGNVLGEGFVLGGVFVIAEQGILLEHRDMEFGDKVKMSLFQPRTANSSAELRYLADFKLSPTRR
uniref:Peroxiredoxin-like 2A n=1 Tax=Stegastes partitus TaxID=144197 RepID=A0A3B5BEC5_9TELE